MLAFYTRDRWHRTPIFGEYRQYEWVHASSRQAEPRHMLESTRTSLVLGIFVGGRGSRLGGLAKGNLKLPSGESLAARLVARSRDALPGTPIVLVGAADAYAHLSLPALADDPAGIGPLGGLRALLAHCQALGRTHALALSCDLPYLEAPLIARLGVETPAAEFLAPREGELWQTFVARYAAALLPVVDATIAAGDRALQRVISRLGERATELVLGARERSELRDWDTPEDAPH
jgi:molybdopterin-guanine dinucleotide biosynthesis protein A